MLFAQGINDEPEDIPQTELPVWILGRQYSALKERDDIRRDIRSRLWFTYRKDFQAIGGCNPKYTSDKGWGCMLRCGQMVLGQALITLHLGREWQWTPETKNKKYLDILKCFEDKRGAPFSIHQIANHGMGEGKEIGQWFGPNTIAQVLKKIVGYNDENSMTIHVALDNTVVINEILNECKIEGCATVEEDGEKPLEVESRWKPLLLLIPLRLGLSEINPVYIKGLKSSFQIEQSLGVIGGKPNLALYFIGCVGDEVIYLDPHTTQRTGVVDNKLEEEEVEIDTTYHCKAASRMPVTGMDPSVALCFFCTTEKEFKSLCESMREELCNPDKQPLFELCAERSTQWSPAEEAVPETIAAATLVDFEPIERQYDTSDEEFELLG